MPTSRFPVLFLALTPLSIASEPIRILLYNYAGVSAQTVGQAKAAASETFKIAGVNVTWADCTSTACSGSANPAVLQVRIIDEQMAKRTHTTRTCLGYAIVSGEFSSIASAFYHRALELEKGNLAQRSDILGAILAHEIGHLLLGSASHSGIGIMRGEWDNQDLKTIARGRMWFTAEEAKKLVANTAARLRALSDTP